MANIKKLPLFVRCVIQNFPFIEEDFDALTNYELISKVVEFLNKVIVSQNEVIGVANDLSEEFQQLHDYVSTYFDNLDVQEEINNKLDAMVEDGTLQEIITAYIQSNVAWMFDTVADMKLADNLVDGSYAQTLGFHSIGDGGGAIYKIKSTGTADEASIIAVGDLKAHLVILDDIKPELFGAYGDGTHNDSTAFNKCLTYVNTLTTTVNSETIGKDIKLTKDYLIDKLSIPQGMPIVRLIGESCRIRGGGFAFNASTGWRVLIKGITFDTCTDPIEMDYRNLEYGRYEIKDCVFNKCSGVCIDIARQSCQTFIDNCTFRDCEKTATIDRCDMFYFTNNWLECTSVHPWGDNHSDVEHISPNGGGSAFITNNIFVPGYNQTASNPAWIKVGGSAVIKENRFSGENISIHPIRINHTFYSTYNPISTLNPIVDIADNTQMNGNTTVLFEHVRGLVSFRNNSGWINRMQVIALTDNTLATEYDSMDLRALQISFSDNSGSVFNFRNGSMQSTSIPAQYKPTIPDCLQRFIKTGKLFAENGNYDVDASITDYVLNIDSGTTNFNKYQLFAVSGYVNKNPGGSSYYEGFLIIASIERYYDTELRYRAVLNVISKNNSSVTFNATINGSAYITALPSGENVTIQISASSPARPYFTGVKCLELEPIGNRLSN